MSGFVGFWLGLGVALLVLELVLPGFVVLFLGLGALLVAALVALGLVSEPLTAGTAWFLISLFLILTLRRFAQRYFPAESSHRDVSEDKDFEDKVVEVVDAVGPDHDRGRVRLQGTTWAARGLDAAIPAGSHARLLYRENLVWVVAPAPPEEAP